MEFPIIYSMLVIKLLIIVIDLLAMFAVLSFLLCRIVNLSIKCLLPVSNIEVSYLSILTYQYRREIC